MNAEAQVTVGTELLHAGFSITEAHGDQPGVLAELDAEARAIGFTPIAYVNFKGFHDPDPSPRVDALLVHAAGEHARAPSPPTPTAASCRSSRCWWRMGLAPGSPGGG